MQVLSMRDELASESNHALGLQPPEKVVGVGATGAPSEDIVGALDAWFFRSSSALPASLIQNN